MPTDMCVYVCVLCVYMMLWYHQLTVRLCRAMLLAQPWNLAIHSWDAVSQTEAVGPAYFHFALLAYHCYCSVVLLLPLVHGGEIKRRGVAQPGEVRPTQRRQAGRGIQVGVE
jgi:hypothetical protein